MYKKISEVPREEFQVGRRVETNGDGDINQKYTPFTGTIKYVEGYRFHILRDDGEIGKGKDNLWQIHYKNDGKIKFLNKPNMSKLSSMMKKLLDKDTQVLVEAGYINGDLDLTDEGTKALLTILFTTHKNELVKDAKEVIADSKEDCK